LEVRICAFEQCITRQLLTISIAPPFWQTVWFGLLMIFLLVIVIYFVVKFYFHQKERKMRAEIESLTKIQKERERISRDLHDNAGSLVTYMLMQLDNEHAAETRTTELKHAARTLMNTLRETIWTLAEHPITNYEFCDKLVTYAKKYVPVAVTFSKRLDKEVLLPKESVLNMYRICQEVFNNILKHSKASHVAVVMTTDDRHRMKIEIEDNGIGFDTGHQNGDTHLGMRNMLSRSEEAGLEVVVVSTPGKGTSITIILANEH
jgi:signal transduction histidine kinase